MKRIITIILILFCIAARPILNNKKKLEPKLKAKSKVNQWSTYQGVMNWHDAKKKCASIGFRLPSSTELKQALKLNLIGSWKENADAYWTSDERSKDEAYFFEIYEDEENGEKDGFGYPYSKVTVSGNVRCIR